MARGNQVLRQWKVLRALEAARRGLTIAELRRAIDEPCAMRTLYRDVEQLAAAGFPITDDEGRWAVVTGGAGAWSVPVDPTEVLALLLTEDLLAPLEGGWLHQPLRDLRSRLTAMLTPTGRKYADELRLGALATLFGPGDLRSKRAVLERVQEAIGKQHRLRIRYAAPRQDAEDRVVEPYCTWFHAGVVYVISYCTKAEDVRTFNVQRIASAEVLDEAFDPDPGFNAAAYARAGFGAHHGPVHRVTIDFSAEVGHLVQERQYHHTQRVMAREGGVRLTMDAGGLPEIAAWVAGFGGHARPRAPNELVEAVRRIHAEGLAALG